MAERFLTLPREERAEILTAAEQQLGRSAQILEKDIWVCWTLQKLFAMPDAHPMAFKGGTSLSKAYGAISRFSEDVDVTFAHESLAPGLDPLEEGISRNQQKERPKRLGRAMDEYVERALKPYFDAALLEDLGDEALLASVGGNERNKHLLVPYPSALDGTAPYVVPHIMLEPGCRNATTPVSTFSIAPDVARVTFEEEIEFPAAEVAVLSGARTFWEKATLMHAACVNPAKRLRVERTARHWYDLAALAKHDVGAEALADLDLLHDVIRVKSVVYPVPDVRYEECASGKLKLVPGGVQLEALAEDYAGMVEARMFWEDPPPFERLVNELKALQDAINASCSSRGPSGK